jgi:hypothetical protein
MICKFTFWILQCNRIVSAIAIAVLELRIGKGLLSSSIYSQSDENWILAHELAAGALVVAGVEVGELGLSVILLPDEPALSHRAGRWEVLD